MCIPAEVEKQLRFRERLPCFEQPILFELGPIEKNHVLTILAFLKYI